MWRMGTYTPVLILPDQGMSSSQNNSSIFLKCVRTMKDGADLLNVASDDEKNSSQCDNRHYKEQLKERGGKSSQ